MNDKEFDIRGNELAIIIRDSLIEKIPLAGSIVIRFLSWEQRVRHERIISFIEDFISSLQDIDKSEINWEYLSSQDFSALIMLVVRRVEQTSSKEKLQRFKDILLKETKTPYLSNFKDTFLDILLKINEDQIKILVFYQKLDNKEISIKFNYTPSQKCVRGVSEVKEGETIARVENVYVNQTYFGMTQEIYDFLMQDLLSKYLLYDVGFNRHQWGHVLVPSVSPLGKEFLLFLKST